jgi:hypothetical protein
MRDSGTEYRHYSCCPFNILKDRHVVRQQTLEINTNILCEVNPKNLNVKPTDPIVLRDGLSTKMIKPSVFSGELDECFTSTVYSLLEVNCSLIPQTLSLVSPILGQNQMHPVLCLVGPKLVV